MELSIYFFMSQKVDPRAYRLHTVTGWNSKWFSPKKAFWENLKEDTAVRAYLKKRYRDASVSLVEIERTNQQIVITVHTAKPGVVIGRSGTGITEAMNDLKTKIVKNTASTVKFNVKEVSSGGKLSAAITAQLMAQDIEKRIPFRRSAKRALEQVMKAGAKGAKLVLSGRLDGAEIAREERFIQGSIPLQTLRADIDYAPATAYTTYGTVGVKVWIYKGEVFEGRKKGSFRPETQGVNEQPLLWRKPTMKTQNVNVKLRPQEVMPPSEPRAGAGTKEVAR